MYDLSWHSFDLKSGRRGPEVIVQSTPALSRMIGEPTEAQVNVLVWDEAEGAPVPGWEGGTEPGRAGLVALDADETPVWAGMVVRRRSDATMWAGVDLATHEAYFDRRYVRDHAWTERDQSSVIAAGVIGDAVLDGIEFTIDAPESGIKRDRTWAADEDKTVLSVLQELMEVIGGPEFTVDLAWTDESHTVLERLVRVRDRIGAGPWKRLRSPDGGRPYSLPVAAFEMPGPVVSFSYVEDYTQDNGANDVMAHSSGEGDARPESDPQVAQHLLDAGWPRYEHRFTPSTSIVRKERLNEHARRELREIQHGLRELTLEAHLDTSPRVGVEFHLGDDVAVSLTCPRFPARVDGNGARWAGYERDLRCIGWEIDVAGRRIKPTLVEVD